MAKVRRKQTIRQMADEQFKTISTRDKRFLGITRTNFRTEFAVELREVRKQRRRR